MTMTFAHVTQACRIYITCLTRPICPMTPELTPGTIQRLHTAPQEDLDFLTTEYVVQFLSLKKVGAATANVPDRYRIIMSDGAHYIQAMLATQLNFMVLDNTLARGSIVALEKLTCNYVKEKRYASHIFLQSEQALNIV